MSQRPRGCDAAKAIQVIVTQALAGAGVDGDPIRNVTQYWSMEGELLAERDPVGAATIQESPKQAAPVASAKVCHHPYGIDKKERRCLECGMSQEEYEDRKRP